MLHRVLVFRSAVFFLLCG